MKQKERHLCELDSESQGYGAAIVDCWEDENGKFFAGNSEYVSQVNYCPICGKKAPVGINNKKSDDFSIGSVIGCTIVLILYIASIGIGCINPGDFFY